VQQGNNMRKGNIVIDVCFHARIYYQQRKTTAESYLELSVERVEKGGKAIPDEWQEEGFILLFR